MNSPLPPDNSLPCPIDDELIAHIIKVGRAHYEKAFMRAKPMDRMEIGRDWTTLSDERKAYWLAKAAWEILQERTLSHVHRLLQEQSEKHKKTLEENNGHFLQMILRGMQGFAVMQEQLHTGVTSLMDSTLQLKGTSSSLMQDASGRQIDDTPSTDDTPPKPAP